jgi:hypothetical protein
MKRKDTGNGSVTVYIGHIFFFFLQDLPTAILVYESQLFLEPVL